MVGKSETSPGFVRGLALAVDAISAPFLIGLAGAVFAWGHDGLAFGLGLGAGFLLLQTLVAPRLPPTGARSLPDYFAQRYGGTLPRLAAALVVVLSMGTLLVAQLMAAGLVTARLVGLRVDWGVFAAAGVLLLAFALRGLRTAAWLRALVFLLMLAALLAPALQLSAEWYGLPVPQLAYGDALSQVRGLEETLLEQELADPAVMNPMLTPFVALDQMNFLGIVLGLALGLASLPHLIACHIMPTSARAARSTTVWGLVFAVALLTLAPALAAYAKLAILKLIAARVEISQLPEWIFTYGRLGLIDVCGVPAIDRAVVGEACAALPDASSVLRLQDLALSPDMITLAFGEITGLGAPMFWLMAAAALAAALVTLDGPLAAIAGAFGCETQGRMGLPARAIGAGALVVAALVAATHPASILDVATWAFTIAAAGLFAPLVVGLWWRRASGPAAVAAMVLGLGLCLHYIAATRYLSVGFFEVWQSLSSAGPTVREIFGELKTAWVTAAPGPVKDAAWAALDAHSQGIANWWGISPLAAVLLALPVTIGAMILVSLVVPQQRATETAS